MKNRLSKTKPAHGDRRDRFFLCYLVVGIKAAYLQVFAGDALSARAVSEYRRDFESIGKRGNIYDAKSRELAVTANVVSIGARPSRMRTRQKPRKSFLNMLGMKKIGSRSFWRPTSRLSGSSGMLPPTRRKSLAVAIPKRVGFYR
jgi:cell division protein FtsI/penicillin-binding protein 2